MSLEVEQVNRFYHDIWNRRDKSAIAAVIDEDFLFRGSLGAEKRGHQGFEDYLDSVHLALADYHCEIEELVQDGTKVFAKMVFKGVHRGLLMGYEPTGRQVSWDGAALFHFNAGKITTLWVLGDVDGLKEQLRRHDAQSD